MSLSTRQKKELFLALFDRIIELHSTGAPKEKLKNFIHGHRQKRTRGVVYMYFAGTREMVASVKSREFDYDWLGAREANQLGHSGVGQAVASMNPSRDCVLVCAIQIENKHLYINCTKMRDIDA